MALPACRWCSRATISAAITLAGYAATGVAPTDGDVLVVAQKIVSKSEGRMVDVATVEPSPEAIRLARETEKDPRFVEIVLSESRRVVRHRPNLIVVEHRLGFVMANAGIDHSNVGPSDGRERVLLLPEDPDGSAERLRQARLKPPASASRSLSATVSAALAAGTVGIAIGAAGLPAVIDWRGQPDLFGRNWKSPRPALPTRSPPPPRWSRGRPPRRPRSCWCAASPGRPPTRPPPKWSAPGARPVPMTAGSAG